MASSNGPTPARAWGDAHKISTLRFQNDLQHSVNSAFNPHPTVYRNVVVVMMRFKQDDIGVVDMEKELADTFTNFFNFKVEYCVFEKEEMPVFKLGKHLNSLYSRGYTDQGNLIILVFSGHGEVREEERQEVLHIGGAVNHRTGEWLTKTMHWYKDTSPLDSVGADVLHILDTCYAATAARGNAEVLAACASTEETPADTAKCFTRALVQELRRNSSNALSVANYQGELQRNKAALGLLRSVFYSERRQRPSIVLQKLQGPAKDMFTNISNGDRVLITAHVDKTLSKKDVESFKTWLLSNVPKKVQKLQIIVEGAFEAESTLLLLSMPIEIWTQLRDDPAYSFVGYVKSGNKMLLPATVTNPLVAKPSGGVENTKPGLPLR